eukprot:m.198392 g.198392  ORF g.198392 m.198392 type:complete len:96 (+) comp18745_c0_seq3:1509-1796(+)
MKYNCTVLGYARAIQCAHLEACLKVNGAAGDVEGTDPTWVKDEKVPFRATNDDGLHTGYARVTVNRTTLDWQFVSWGVPMMMLTHLTLRTEIILS